MEKRDINIIGNDFTSVALAYNLSTKIENKSITLFFNQDIPHYLFTPGNIFPLLGLSKEKLMKYYKKNTKILEELSYLTRDFEIFTSPLLIWTKKEDIKKIKECKNKLDYADIGSNILENTEIKSEFPLLNPTTNDLALVIFNQKYCSSVLDVIESYFKLLEDKSVEIIYYKENEIQLEEKGKIIAFKDKKYQSNDYLWVTDDKLIEYENSANTTSIMAKTPIIEKFPQINLLDIRKKIYISPEKEGYVNIYQTNLIEQEFKLIKENIISYFQQIFPFLKPVTFLDHLLYKEINKIYWKENFFINGYYLKIPFAYEISIVPYLTTKIAEILSRDKLETNLLNSKISELNNALSKSLF